MSLIKCAARGDMAAKAYRVVRQVEDHTLPADDYAFRMLHHKNRLDELRRGYEELHQVRGSRGLGHNYIGYHDLADRKNLHNGGAYHMLDGYRVAKSIGDAQWRGERSAKYLKEQAVLAAAKKRREQMWGLGAGAVMATGAAAAYAGHRHRVKQQELYDDADAKAVVATYKAMNGIPD